MRVTLQQPCGIVNQLGKHDVFCGSVENNSDQIRFDLTLAKRAWNFFTQSKMS